MKIAHIVGNRPQFIKLSLLHRAWQARTGDPALIIHTGQHFSDNMSAIFFDQFHIPAPDHQLQINSLSHNEMIGRMLIALDPILAAEQPDGIIVYGDTNTTLAGALAAKKRNIRLAHVESGVRTGKDDMPEESNRYVTDRLADLNFACTVRGVENLLKEGFAPDRVFHSGDLMLDAALLFRDKAKELSSIRKEWHLTEQSFVLATIHRAENAEDPAVLGEIIRALNIIHKSQPVLFPLHPKTRQLIDKHGIPVDFIVTPPLGYLDMQALLQTCHYVITDSGGLSREAFFLHKPVLVVMQNPFWPEIFEHGPCLQAAALAEDILEKSRTLQTGRKPFKTEIFGDGNAAVNICDILRAAWQDR